VVSANPTQAPPGDVRTKATHSSTSGDSSVASSRGAAQRADTAWYALAQFTLRWTWNDRGWLVIAALGVLNVVAHAASAASPLVIDAAGVVALVQEHARLFLILLATIYAGELLWRDHDERVAELIASTPITPARLLGTRLLGLVGAECALVLTLLAGAWIAVAIAHDVVSLVHVVAYGLLWLLVPFVQWTVLSLAVHAVVRDKIIGHLLLIAGWVLAVVLDANGVDSPWVRFADPPVIAAGETTPLSVALLRAAGWTAVCAGLFVLAAQRQRRITSRR
jgi:hypothetical protein